MAKLNNQNRTPIGGANLDGGVIDAGPIKIDSGEKSLKNILDYQKLITKLLTKKPTTKKANTIQKFIDKIKSPISDNTPKESTNELLTQIRQHESELETFRSRISKGKDTELSTK